MAELLDQARQLLAAGPYDARPAQVAAVHAALYPDREAVCLTCRHELGRAYFAIKRWAEAQPDFSTSTSTNVKKSPTTARFKSDATIYTPHGLGVAYSNTNLTDKAARDIIKNDPDAVGLFDVLPGEADEDEQDLTPAQVSAKAAEQAQAPTPAQALPAGFDYAKLAAALLDEQDRRHAANTNPPAAAAAPEQPALTASAGGAADGSQATDKTDSMTDNAGTDADGEEKPVRLSRMNKDQLVATYTAELGHAPAEGLTNDELRDAIAEKRAGQQDPE